MSLRLCMLAPYAPLRSFTQQVYIDFGCRFKSTWQRYASAEGIAAEELQIMVNWMHGSSHEIACQLKNSGRFKARVGHRVGERRWSSCGA